MASKSLSRDSPEGSPSTSPSRPSTFSKPAIPAPPQESTISRLVIAPLTFISFLISLFLIDTHNHSLRTHSHHTHRPPPTSVYGKAKHFLHSLFFKPTYSSENASPYAYVQNPALLSSSEKVGLLGKEEFSVKSVEGVEGQREREREKWYWHTQQSKMMKAEVADAFKIRKWVVVVLLLGGGWVLLFGWVVFGWIGALLSGGKGENMLGGDW